MARPSKFNETLSEKILQLYDQGKTDRQVAEIIGVCEKTINNWKVSQPEFLQSIRERKQIADQMVEAALFSRAVGYSYLEEQIAFYEGEWIPATRVKHFAPDVTACKFWLMNRQPENWRESQNETPKPLDITPSKPLKKTFKEFAVTAGYFDPFDEQVEMMKFAIEETDTRLLLGARGYGKTDYCTIIGVAYDIYCAYTDGLEMDLFTNLIITKSKQRNKAILNEIANALTKNGVELEKENSNEIRVKGLIGQDHSVEAITIKTSMRGRHPKRIIMDDPVTDEDVSDAMRTLVKAKYDEAYKLCKNIVIIGQPAHKHDLYAELRGIIQTLEMPYGKIPALDVDLEAMKLAGVNQDSIEMSYHLRIPKSGSTPFDNVKYMDKFPTGDSAVAFIDPSHEGGDYTAISIFKSHMDSIAVVGFVYKKAWNHCLDEIVPKLKLYNVKKLCFETNALGDMPIEILRGLVPKDVGVMGRRSNNSKHSRIMAAGAYAHMIHLSRESDKTYIDHVVQYEYKSKFDDAPDSLATGLEWIGLIRGKQ